MKEYTVKEFCKIIDTAIDRTPALSLKQLLTLFKWSLFNRKKLYIFCEGIEKGKSNYFAFKDASK